MVLKIMRNGPNFSVLHYFQFFPITGSNIWILLLLHLKIKLQW
jgi:hypothetical protein